LLLILGGKRRFVILNADPTNGPVTVPDNGAADALSANYRRA